MTKLICWAIVRNKYGWLWLLSLWNHRWVNQPNENGLTPLLLPAGYPANDFRILRRPLAKGADPTATDQRGYTALHVAVEYGFEAAVEILLQHGIDQLEVRVAAFHRSEGWPERRLAGSFTD